MIQNSTSTLEVRWLHRRIQRFPFHISPFCLWNIKSQILRWRCQILWIVEDYRGLSFFSRWSFKNVSHNTCTILCISRQSRIAARQSSGTQNNRSLIRNVGRSRAAPGFKIVWQGIHFHGRRIPPLLHRQFFTSCLSRLLNFFATYSSQFFNFLAISCMILLEESISRFHFSIQANFYLSEPDQPIGLLDLIEIAEIQILDWLLETNSSDFAFPNSSPQSPPQPDTIFFWASFSPWMAMSTFRSKIFCRLSRSLNACTKLNSRSLFPLDFEIKSVVATDSRSNSTSVSWWLERLDTWPTPVLREVVWPNKDETLLAAALRLLLNTSEFGIPLALPEIMVTSPEHRKSGLLWEMSIWLWSRSV